MERLDNYTACQQSKAGIPIWPKNLRYKPFPPGEEEKKSTKNMFKATMAEKFLNLGREMDIPIHEAQRT